MEYIRKDFVTKTIFSGVIFFLFPLLILAYTDAEQCQQMGYSGLGQCTQSGFCQGSGSINGLRSEVTCEGCPTYKICCQRKINSNDPAPLSPTAAGCIEKVKDDPSLAVPVAPDVNFKPQVTIPGTIFTARQPIKVDGDTVALYLNALFKFLTGAIVVMAVVMIMWGGFKRIAAAGSEETIKGANETILGAVSGLILVLIAYTLLNLINPQLVNLKSLDIDKVDREPFYGESSDSGVADVGSNGDDYKQCDPAWGNMAYVEANNKSCNLCSSGCGATAVAIVMKKKGLSVTPKDIGQYAIDVGARKGCSGGTRVATLIEKLSKKWSGVKYNVITDFVAAKKALKDGRLLIVSVRKVPIYGQCKDSKCGEGLCFCDGHFIVLSGLDGFIEGYENVKVIDPSRRNVTSFKFDELRRYMSRVEFYEITK